ncbi:MAG: hypothetical protein ACRDTE_12985 [Pseudonocardiaceae bacterium]
MSGELVDRDTVAVAGRECGRQLRFGEADTGGVIGGDGCFVQ